MFVGPDQSDRDRDIKEKNRINRLALEQVHAGVVKPSVGHQTVAPSMKYAVVDISPFASCNGEF